MNKLFFSIAIFSIVSLFFLYFYTLENFKNSFDKNNLITFEYALKNPEKYEGREIYTGFEIESTEGKNVIAKYHTIFPSKANKSVLLINEKNFKLENGKAYGFKIKI
ncbi:MAG: hypothetical protein ACK4YO_01290, partial [Candidatus Altarchaeaceae archaeon]